VETWKRALDVYKIVGQTVEETTYDFRHQMMTVMLKKLSCSVPKPTSIQPVLIDPLELKPFEVKKARRFPVEAPVIPAPSNTQNVVV